MALLATLIHLYSLLILGAVILSWVPLPRDNPIVKGVELLTEPVLAPVRRLLPDTGGIDFSAIVVLVILHVLSRALM